MANGGKYAGGVGTRRQLIVGAAACAAGLAVPPALAQAPAEPKRIGVIGLDTSHAPAFAKLFNDAKPDSPTAGFRVTAAYPRGSADIESSVTRIPAYTEQMRAMGVEIVDSIAALLGRVDVVLLETNDGRPHLEQALAAVKAGKPVFVDKPLAASLADAAAILMAGERAGVAVYSASSLRYAGGLADVRAGVHGKVHGALAWSPMSIEPTHPDLYWYGIHGVEMLYTAMGAGCESVRRIAGEANDVSIGRWADGRIGEFRGILSGKKEYGGAAFTEKAVVTLGPYMGYEPLCVAIAGMWRSGKAPVDAGETLELYAFMSAADESKRRGGEAVKVAELIDQANREAAARLKAAGL